MKTLATWLKVTVYFEPAFDLARNVLDEVRSFETHFKIQQLYFSRYVTTTKNTVEISCLTLHSHKVLKRYFNKKKYVLAVAVENRGSGSLAHCHGYRAVSSLLGTDKDSESNWNDMLDLVHWMCNMRGYDYTREIRFYGYGAFCFANQIIKQNDEFYAKVQGKAPAEKGAAPVSARAPQSKPAGSSRVAARKASG